MSENGCSYQTSTGIKLWRQDLYTTPSAPVWEICAGVQQMPQPSLTASVGQCSDFDSVGEGLRVWDEKYKTGKFTQADMNTLLNLKLGDPTQNQMWRDFLAVGTEERIPFRIVFPDAAVTTFQFVALVTAYGLTIPEISAGDGDSIVQTPITFVGVGEPTWIES